jgi:transposase
MDDINLYTQILGLEKPWVITDIKLDLINEEVKLLIKYDSSIGSCPICHKDCSIYDRRNQRSWRHLDTCQMKTYLAGDVPRVKCLEHGVQTISVPWAESSSRFTMLFEQFTINLLQATQNQTKAASILRISFHQIHLIMQKAVQRGLSRRGKIDVEYMAIDEKSMKKGHTYITVVSDLKTGTIIDIVKDRTGEAVNLLLNNLKKVHNFLPLKAVSMDMWKPFMNEVSAAFPYSDIVHDKFHIIKYLNDAVDKTRIAENKILTNEQDTSLEKSKYLFLKNEENMTDKQAIRFNVIKEMTLKTCQAWRIKENFKGFFRCTFINEAKTYFSQWFNDVKESGLPKMMKVATMLINHSAGLLNYIKHKISNGIAENLNGQIQRIKTVGRGFNSFENYRNAILFYLGKLDMDPHKT